MKTKTIMKLWLGMTALLTALLFVPVALTGCGTTAQKAAYRSAATTSVTVEQAVKAYNVAAKNGQTTIAQNAQVKAAYQKYQASFAVVCDAGAIYAASGNTNAPAAAALQQAVQQSSETISDLVNLVRSFGIKL